MMEANEAEKRIRTILKTVLPGRSVRREYDENQEEKIELSIKTALDLLPLQNKYTIDDIITATRRCGIYISPSILNQHKISSQVHPSSIVSQGV